MRLVEERVWAGRSVCCRARLGSEMMLMLVIYSTSVYLFISLFVLNTYSIEGVDINILDKLIIR